MFQNKNFQLRKYSYAERNTVNQHCFIVNERLEIVLLPLFD